MNQLAPYAKHLPADHRNLWIYSGPRAWILAQWRVKSGLPVLVLPPGRDPSEFQWPVLGTEITVVDSGSTESLLEALAHNLLASGASLVCVSYGEPRTLAVFRQKEMVDVA